MSDFKFRAWTKDKRMVYHVTPFTWDYCISKLTSKCIESNGPGVLGSGGSSARFEVVGYSILGGALMQWTGFRDKEGYDIYVSDILTSLSNGHWTNYLVSIENGCLGVRNIGIEGYLSEFHMIDGPRFFENMEVLGNIFENPDLLK